MPTPSEFEVPADRPHFAVWPRRLPRAVIAPETSLWFNLEVAATRFPDRPRISSSVARLTYRQMRDDADRARRLAAESGRRGRRPGRRLHAELPAVSGRAVRDPARECGRRAGQPDEPRRGVQALHHRSRHQGRDLQRRPGGDRRRRQRGAARKRARSRHRRDALHRRDAGRRRSPRPMRRRRRWTPGCAPIRRCRPAARAGPKRWRNGCSPGRISAKARRSGAAALHVGNDRDAERLHAHASHADAQHRRRPVELCRRPRAGRPRRRADVPHHRHALQRARLGLLRLDRRPHAALGSRARRPADLAAPHLALGLHPDDGDRPVRQPQLQELRPVEPAQHQRRRRGDAVRGRAAAAGRVRPDVRRGLRPHRDGGAEPRQSARARQAAVPRHPDLRRRLARRRSGHARGAAARRGRRDHHPRPDGLHRLLEPSRGDRRRRSSSSTAASSSAPATSAGWTRKATSSSPTGSSG